MNDKWGIRIPILPDEIFSSWLVRVALTLGCDPLVLTGSLWPGWRIWTIDLDRGLNDERMETLEVSSGIPKEEFEKTMLRSISQIISSDQYGQKVVWPWILALGSRNRIHKGGIQFCPVCLSEDKIPYFRREWRYAWHTVCSKHQCRLHDKCPQCGSPAEIHRLDAIDERLSVCASCKYDYRKAPIYRISNEDSLFQHTVDYVVINKQGQFGDIIISSSDWFLFTRYIVNLLRRASLGKQNGLKDFFSYVGVDVGVLLTPATGLPLELLPIEERIMLFNATSLVLSTGPIKLIESAKKASLSVQSLKDQRQQVPRFFEKILNELPENRIIHKERKEKIVYKPRSKQTVMHMWARLKRNLPRGSQ